MSKTGFFRNFLRSLKKSNYFKLVGEDNLANKYFESISGIVCPCPVNTYYVYVSVEYYN